MITNENYRVSQGSAITIQSAIVDQAGNVVTTYTGSETLTTLVWPGGAQPSSYSPVTTWVTPSAGLISIVIPAADSSALSPGRYQVLTRVTAAMADPVDGYGCTLDVLQAPAPKLRPQPTAPMPTSCATAAPGSVSSRRATMRPASRSSSGAAARGSRT